MFGYRTSKKGFTLIELLVGMLALAVLVLTITTMLVYGWRTLFRSRDQVGMQRDASLAMQIIAKEIRNSAYGDISGGSSLYFGGSGVTFSESGTSIVNDDGFKLVNGWLDPGSFTSTKYQVVDAEGKTEQWVEVSFTLETSTLNETYTISVTPRN